MAILSQIITPSNVFTTSSTIPVANGGTGAANAANARTNLGLAIGTNVQAYDAELTAIAALAPTTDNFIVGNGTTWILETPAQARTSLGGTTVGQNVFTLPNPSAIRFLRVNADNTVSALTDTDFRTAIGAGTGNGTVTSVTGTSPVASSGGTTPAISLSAAYGDTLNPYGSKAANFFLAAPNGLAGVPTFRAIVAADIPTLNQNTTGSAATLTTARTIQTNLASTTAASFNGSANITPGVTGTLPVGNGGTGAATFTAGAYLKGNGTSAIQVQTGIPAGDITSGTLGVARGGTGAATLAANNVLLGNGTSALQVVAPGSNGNVLTSNGTTWTSAALTVAATPFTENLDVVSTNYTIATGKNALSVGPMTINSGVVVTVSSGQRWLVV